MGLLDNLFNRGTRMKLVTENGNSFYAWNGKLYQSDIVRSCIRPKVKAIGKLNMKHIRAHEGKIEVNPDPYMRFLLEEPNPYMTGQVMLEKMATQLCLNGNAFILIIRDDMGMPAELYPVPAEGVEARYNDYGDLILRFSLQNGKRMDAPYSDVIHIRDDYNSNDIFGDSPLPALKSLMEVLNTSDQGVVQAIKNGSNIRWLLKFKTVLKPDDIKNRTNEFTSAFLDSANGNGVAAGIDPSMDAQQVNPHDVMPNAAISKQALERLYSFFNTNEAIVQSSYTEDQWNAYYELQIEPVALQLRNEFSRKLFSRKQRAFGNYIAFDAANLACASITTKLALVSMVDRGALTPNEWREVFNLSPIEYGDTPLRRLDTIALASGEGGDTSET